MGDVGELVYPSSVTQFAGLRIVDLAEGAVTIGMAASRWLTNWGGIIYGGAIALLAEGASTSAILSTLPPATACAPLDLKVNSCAQVSHMPVRSQHARRSSTKAGQ